MSIPVFNKQGNLPDGIHICSGLEFISRYCNIEFRSQFIKPVSDILDFAMDRGAVYLFVGGSFITSEGKPNDFDCVMVFEDDRSIPSQTEKVYLAGLKFDILYASLENEKLIDTYIKLFTDTRIGGNKGIVQIDLYDREEVWEIKHQPDEETFEIIKRAYNDRSMIDVNQKEGILVTVHGLYSNGDWNMNIAPVASNQNWIFAPYFYDNNNYSLIFNETRRKAIVDDFREWIYNIKQKYNNNISIIAHSFGSYIVGSYLMGFDIDESLPVSFNSIILTGSILHPNFNWEQFRGKSVGAIYNMKSPNDEWVKHMPNADLKKLIGMDELFGTSGLDGFTDTTSMLTESVNEIFKHTNSIETDIIETKWMPFLKANKYALYLEGLDYIKRKIDTQV